MILPTKHLPESRCLIRIGADVLSVLGQPRTVSFVWDVLGRPRKNRDEDFVTYDWFVLALDFLALTGLIRFEEGRLSRVA